MDDAKTIEQPANAVEIRRRGRPPNINKFGAGKIDAPKDEGLDDRLDWPAIESLVNDIELAYPNERVVKVFCNCDSPELWMGVFGNAPVIKGETAVQFNTGRILPI